jgi:hypothetical protein
MPSATPPGDPLGRGRIGARPVHLLCAIDHFAPVVDFRLTDGCVRFLVFLRTRIGRSDSWRVLTGSIAKQIGRTRRTVLNYIHEAVPAGVLISEFDRRTGITTLRLTEQMEPPLPKPPRDDREPWPREPKPQLWWPKAAASALRKGGCESEFRH